MNPKFLEDEDDMKSRKGFELEQRRKTENENGWQAIKCGIETLLKSDRENRLYFIFHLHCDRDKA